MTNNDSSTITITLRSRKDGDPSLYAFLQQAFSSPTLESTHISPSSIFHIFSFQNYFFFAHTFWRASSFLAEGFLVLHFGEHAYFSAEKLLRSTQSACARPPKSRTGDLEIHVSISLSLCISNPTALPFGRLAQRGGASTGKSQQRFIRVSPKGMGKKEPVLKIRKAGNRKAESVQ